MNEAAGAADHGAEIRALSSGIRAVESNSAITNDRAACGERARGATRTNLECAGIDGGPAGVGIRAGEDERSVAALRQGTGARDIAADGDIPCGRIHDAGGGADEGEIEVDRLGAGGIVDDVAL